MSMCDNFTNIRHTLRAAVRRVNHKHPAAQHAALHALKHPFITGIIHACGLRNLAQRFAHPLMPRGGRMGYQII